MPPLRRFQRILEADETTAPASSSSGLYNGSSPSHPTMGRLRRCYVCSKPPSTGFSEPLKQCSICRRQYHFDCHVPPLDVLRAAVESIWQCSRCDKKPKVRDMLANASHLSREQAEGVVRGQALVRISGLAGGEGPRKRIKLNHTTPDTLETTTAKEEPKRASNQNQEGVLEGDIHMRSMAEVISQLQLDSAHDTRLSYLLQVASSQENAVEMNEFNNYVATCFSKLQSENAKNVENATIAQRPPSRAEIIRVGDRMLNYAQEADTQDLNAFTSLQSKEVPPPCSSESSPAILIKHKKASDTAVQVDLGVAGVATTEQQRRTYSDCEDTKNYGRGNANPRNDCSKCLQWQDKLSITQSSGCAALLCTRCAKITPASTILRPEILVSVDGIESEDLTDTFLEPPKSTVVLYDQSMNFEVEKFLVPAERISTKQIGRGGDSLPLTIIQPQKTAIRTISSIAALGLFKESKEQMLDLIERRMQSKPWKSKLPATRARPKASDHFEVLRAHGRHSPSTNITRKGVDNFSVLPTMEREISVPEIVVHSKAREETITEKSLEYAIVADLSHSKTKLKDCGMIYWSDEKNIAALGGELCALKTSSTTKIAYQERLLREKDAELGRSLKAKKALHSQLKTLRVQIASLDDLVDHLKARVKFAEERSRKLNTQSFDPKDPSTDHIPSQEQNNHAVELCRLQKELELHKGQIERLEAKVALSGDDVKRVTAEKERLGLRLMDVHDFPINQQIDKSFEAEHQPRSVESRPELNLGGQQTPQSANQRPIEKCSDMNSLCRLSCQDIQTEKDIEIDELKRQLAQMKQVETMRNKSLQGGHLVHTDILANFPWGHHFDAEVKKAEIERRPSRKATFGQVLANTRQERGRYPHRERQRPTLLVSTGTANSRGSKNVSSFEMRHGRLPVSDPKSDRRSDSGHVQTTEHESSYAHSDCRSSSTGGDNDDDNAVEADKMGKDKDEHDAIEKEDEAAHNRRILKHFNKMMGVPDNPIPVLVNGHLAFRDGTRDARGRLPRSKATLKVGRWNAGEARG